MAFAEPGAAKKCSNNVPGGDDRAIAVTMGEDGSMTIDLHESTIPLSSKQILSSGNTKVVINQPVKMSGEGEEWTVEANVMAVYNPERNELSLAYSTDGSSMRGATEPLSCD